MVIKRHLPEHLFFQILNINIASINYAGQTVPSLLYKTYKFINKLSYLPGVITFNNISVTSATATSIFSILAVTRPFCANSAHILNNHVYIYRGTLMNMYESQNEAVSAKCKQNTLLDHMCMYTSGLFDKGQFML